MSTRWDALDRSQSSVLRSTLAANATVFFDQTATAVALALLGRDLGMRAADPDRAPSGAGRPGGRP